MNFGLFGLLGLVFFVFIAFFVFKQIQFFFTAVDLYKGMNQRLDKIIELLSVNPALAETLRIANAQVVPKGGSQGVNILPVAASISPAIPHGTCPNCEAVIPLQSKDCPKCKASFDIGSAWKVRER